MRNKYFLFPENRIFRDSILRGFCIKLLQDRFLVVYAHK
ncbi:hypothetical protein QE436_000713 [Pantoea anthophila]|nr:hypothetical protein [Pantoea anthophila]